MSMFMASMRQAARDGELDGMGMFGAALKADVADYERRLRQDEEAPSPALEASTLQSKGG
jgi:hypothetical protein